MRLETAVGPNGGKVGIEAEIGEIVTPARIARAINEEEAWVRPTREHLLASQVAICSVGSFSPRKGWVHINARVLEWIELSPR